MDSEFFNYFSFLGELPALFIISMIPIVELRGAIIVAALNNVNWFWAYIVSVIGNLLPIPFVILFARTLFDKLRTVKFLRKPAGWYERRVLSKADEKMKYSLIALCIFVAIPLPGTGAWTGAAIASVLDMRIKKAFPAIAIGVLIAGVVMEIVCYAVPAVFGSIV